MNEKKLMNRAADNIRILAASMVEKANSGHPGGAMGGADFVNVLFSEFLVYDPENPRWEGRDRFFLDPGHMSPMLYSTLALTGKFTMEELAQFRQWGSPTPGHPEVDIMRGIENTSGPLGQGHTFAVGAAIAAKFLKARLGHVMDQTIYAYISDGGIQEEISQGAGRLAGHLGLDNLIMFSTSVASTPRTLAEALRVASPAFCSITFQFTFGALPENHSSNLAASSGLALVHSALAAYFSATIFFSSSARLAYNSFTSGKIWKGLVGSPPKFLIVLM